jgi:hypothetical protein
MATLTIYNTEAEGTIEFTSPMSRAELKGCHEVQNLGAVQTYLRRYLWTTAMEIVEHDALDATTGSVEVKPKAAPKPVEKREEIKGQEGPWQMVTKTPPEGDPKDWLETVGKTAEVALAMAQTKADVMDIFKKNKELFDAVKATDADFFKRPDGLIYRGQEKFTEAA